MPNPWITLSWTLASLIAAAPIQAQAQTQPRPAEASPRQYLAATAHFLHPDQVSLAALPEPPQPGSLAAAADLEAILQLQAWRTPEQVSFAKRIDHLDAFDGSDAIGPWFIRERLPRCAQVLEQAMGDGESLNHLAKLKFKRLRPPFTDPRVQPCTPVHPPSRNPPTASYYSYPSGHSTSIHILAGVLCELVPERSEAIQAWAHKAAWSRMIAGVHFPSDAMGGQLLAGITLQALKANPAFQAALDACRAELRAAQPAMK